MKRILPLTALFLVMMAILTGCGLSAVQSVIQKKELARELGLDLSKGVVVTEQENYGWFGDGETYLEIQFDNASAWDTIQQDKQWKDLPMEQTAQALLYGVTMEDKDGGEMQIGPYFHQGEKPDIQQGKYLLLDRFEQADPAEAPDVILERGCLNVTLAVYDAEKHYLYVYRLDT